MECSISSGKTAKRFYNLTFSFKGGIGSDNFFRNLKGKGVKEKKATY